MRSWPFLHKKSFVEANTAWIFCPGLYRTSQFIAITFLALFDHHPWHTQSFLYVDSEPRRCDEKKKGIHFHWFIFKQFAIHSSYRTYIINSKLYERFGVTNVKNFQCHLHYYVFHVKCFEGHTHFLKVYSLLKILFTKNVIFLKAY